MKYTWTWRLSSLDAHGVIILLCLVIGGLAAWLSFSVDPHWKGQEVPAVVARVEVDGKGMMRPVFKDAHGREYTQGVWSSRSAYAEGDRILMVQRDNGRAWYVRGDRSMQRLGWGLRYFSAVFLSVSLVSLVMKLARASDRAINRAMGSLGALWVGVPLLLLGPVSWAIHRQGAAERYGLTLSEGDVRGGFLMSLLGLLVVAGTVWCLRSPGAAVPPEPLPAERRPLPAERRPLPAERRPLPAERRPRRTRRKTRLQSPRRRPSPRNPGV